MFFTVSPPSPNGSPSFEVVNLSIFANSEDFVGLFDCIEVWRSRGTEGGPYEELTSSTWRGARLPSAGLDQPSVVVSGANVNVVGLKLELILNEKDSVLVTFTGTDPITLNAAATQIATQSLGRLRAWVDANYKLVIETMEPGTGAALRVVPSDAASFLGLPTQEPEVLAFGKEARIPLLVAQSSYNFSDRAGSSAYFYKTRFRDRATNTVSEFSQVYSSEQVAAVDQDHVILGYIDLISSDGRPMVGIEVSLRSPFVGSLVAGKLVAGNDLMKKTDSKGHAEFFLVRGQKYTLAISGTNIAKEIETPTDLSITSFLLVDAEFGTQDDYFRARIPNIPTMERRSF